MDAALLAKHGSWPVAGGWLDQTKSVVQAVTYIWNCQKAESPDHG